MANRIILETEQGQAALVSVDHQALPDDWPNTLATVPVNRLQVDHTVTLTNVQVRIAARDVADNALFVHITAHQLRGRAVDIKNELLIAEDHEVHTLRCSALSVCRALRLLAPDDDKKIDTLLYLLTALEEGDLPTYIKRQDEFEQLLGCTLVERCTVTLPTTSGVLARGWVNQLIDDPGVMVIRDDGMYVHRPSMDSTSCGLTLLDYVYLTCAAQQAADMVSDVWVDELPPDMIAVHTNVAVGFNKCWHIMIYWHVRDMWCLLDTPSTASLRAHVVRVCLDDLRAWMATHALIGNETQLAQYENEVQKVLNEEV